ncbi:MULTISPECIES: DUF397 domain-containing protein [unclassified Streptosporangium]|uniref:DUF397 domain-containing protein n=1 Tax=unclassified Streptosporangium TaxID=2632669 RepID=UPI002E2E7400|nr:MULTISPECIES: DUF397 domain-containing protein [unclassified Streptosporangium]
MDRIPSGLIWRKSSQSAQQDNCVETAALPGGGCSLRDSKDPNGPVLSFAGDEWRKFVGSVKSGLFDGLSH